MQEQLTLAEANKKILPLALPMMGTQLITEASAFLCMTMVAQLGRETLAASALIFSTQLTVIVVAMSIFFSLSILVGHAYGAREYPEIGHFMRQSWMLAIAIGVIATILLWDIGSFLIFIGEPKPLAEIAQVFFRAHTWRVIPLLLAICNQQLCYGIHKQKLDLVTNMLGVIVLLVIAYTLILGKFGFPRLGVAGLAYAMTAQTYFYLLFTSAYFYFEKSFKRFELFNYHLHENWHHLVKLFKLGWPFSLLIVGEMLSLFVNAAMVGWLGTDALAAYQVILQFLFLILIPIFALSQTSGVLIGQAYGAQKFFEVKKLGYASLCLTFILATLTGILFISFPKELASLYLNVRDPVNAETIRLIILLFTVVAVSVLFDATRDVLMGALRGLLDTKLPMIIGLATIWLIGMPLSYLFAFTFHWGVVGIALGSGSGMFIGALLMLYRWCKQSQKYSIEANKYFADNATS